MFRKYVTVMILNILMLFTAQGIVNAKEEFNVLFSIRSISVVLSAQQHPSKGHLSSYGRAKCHNETICIIWFFDDLNKARVGIEKAKAGNMFDPIPGLIAIYSKNRKLDEIICYEPMGGC